MPMTLRNADILFNDSTTLSSGNIPTDNLGSGTANSNTFLRGDKVWATPPSPAPTTAQVLNATKSASAGAVGTYAFLGHPSTGVLNVFGSTRAGSGLRPAGIRTTNSTNFGSAAPTADGQHGGEASARAGTWRCMGIARGFTSRAGATLWLRIS